MTNHIDLINNTITIDLGSYAAIVIGFVLMTLLGVLFFLLSIKTRQLLDRYRLKYSFDREIEKKEMDNPTEDKLNRREKYFKKRTFID